MACSGSGNTGWQPSSRTLSTPSILILMGLHRLSHIPMLVEGGLSGLTLQHKNATGPIHTVLPSTSWPCTARACHWRLWPVNSRSTNSPAVVPWTNASWDKIYTLTRITIQLLNSFNEMPMYCQWVISCIYSSLIMDLHSMRWQVPATHLRNGLLMASDNHVWPSTQPNWITHNLAAQHWAAYNLAVRWCAGSVLCVTS